MESSGAGDRSKMRIGMGSGNGEATTLPVARGCFATTLPARHQPVQCGTRRFPDSSRLHFENVPGNCPGRTLHRLTSLYFCAVWAYSKYISIRLRSGICVPVLGL